jgi:hypothetical protein
VNISNFPSFSVFLAIFHVLKCVFLFFGDFQFPSHIPGLQYAFLIFHVFHYFSTYSRSNSFFSLIFQIVHFSRHIPGTTVYISYFSHFLVFLAIFIQSFCLIFYVFQFSDQNPGPTVCISHFSRFSLFLAIF